MSKVAKEVKILSGLTNKAFLGAGGISSVQAVNRDEEAAIFQHARYGLVGDALEILPELIRVAQETKA